MQSSNKTVSTGAIIGLLSLAVTASPALAGGELINNASQTTNPTSVTPIDNSTPQVATGSTIIPSGSISTPANQSTIRRNSIF
jgi:hypothetical protein